MQSFLLMCARAAQALVPVSLVVVWGTSAWAQAGGSGSSITATASPVPVVAPSSVNLNAVQAAPSPASAGGARAGLAEVPADTDPSDTRATVRKANAGRAPSQFQRFVQEATGQMLPLFGAELFASGSTFAPDTTLPAPADYVLGAGDEVRVNVWGGVDYSGQHVIDRNGQIHLPKVGAIPLAGVPVKGLESVIRNRIARTFTNFDLSAAPGQLRALSIYVVGQAQQPGVHRVPGLSTLVNAVFASGGPNANGSMRRIELKRAGRTLTTLDLYDFIAQGNKGADVPLQSGDVIVIPPAGPRVAITGAFDHAAIYELKPGANALRDLLGLHGSLPTLVSTRKALLERVDPTQSPARQVQNTSLNPEGLATPLRDSDIVTLLSISPAFANAVTLQGNVAAPLRYPYFSGMRVQDLIPERDALITADYYRRKNLLVQSAAAAEDAGKTISQRVRKLVDEINWEYAVIERLNKEALTTELLPFNLRKAVIHKDPAHNLALLPGDVVTVLSHTDVRLPQERRSRLVRIEGEVASPGVYQALPGETLPQILSRIGGLTPEAYVFGTELQRESIKALQQNNLSTLIRQLEQQQTSRVQLPSGQDAASLAQAKAAQEQQQAQIQAQLNRLKTLQSTGRLALELPAQAQLGSSALPNLPLEDGDRIHVPATPGFVAAVGAVYNENVFIYKSGKTVGEVIKTAGLTDDADDDATFVLRADGTVISSVESSGWFGRRSISSLLLMPGDTVVVPAKVDRESRYSFITRVVKDWTQIFSNFGLGVAALKTIKSL